MKEEEGGKEAKALGFQRLPGFSKIKRWLEFSDNFGKTIKACQGPFPLQRFSESHVKQFILFVCLRRRFAGQKEDALKTNGYPPSGILKSQAVTEGDVGHCPQKNDPLSDLPL